MHSNHDCEKKKTVDVEGLNDRTNHCKINRLLLNYVIDKSTIIEIQR